MQMINTKLQERGYTTVPQEVRERLGVAKGATLTFIIFEDGRIELRANVEEKAKAAMEAFDLLGEAFKVEGMTMEQFIEKARNERGEIFKESYPELYKRLLVQKEQV